MNKWFDAGEINLHGIGSLLENAVESGQIGADDTVWYGPSGDVVVARGPEYLEDKYLDYTDEGRVREYL